MSFIDVVFYVFAVITVMAGVGVVVSRNPVHAALFLVLAFCSAAGIWMLLEAEFLAGGVLELGRVGAAEARLLDARGVLAVMSDLATRGVTMYDDTRVPTQQRRQSRNNGLGASS